MPAPLLVTFLGGTSGTWEIVSQSVVVGDGLPAASRLEAYEGVVRRVEGNAWTLRGVTSNERYVERPERQRLVARQPPMSRMDADCSALIPIRKNEAWWNLTQEERRAVFEARSRHIALGLEYLPAVARRLHHSRDLGEPFDFLTWFEFAGADQHLFEDLVGRLRETEEWSYVEREVDIRLRR